MSFFGPMVPFGGYGRQLPVMRAGDWWDWPVPSRLFDQPFGMGWEEEFIPYWARQAMATAEAAAGHEGGTSHVTNNKEKFQVDLNVSHFRPEEIKVTQKEKELVIEGKHEERSDAHGLVYRHFTRKYALPKDVEGEKLVSTLSADGMLSVKAPKKEAIEGPKPRNIPIEHAPKDEKKK